MLNRWEGVNLTTETGKIVSDNTGKLAELNRQQLMKGLDSEGNELSPKISQDPYFKKPGAAKRYADWKHKLFPETPYDSPNLNITGYYHSEIDVTVNGDKIGFGNGAPFAASVREKYRDKQLGLNPQSKIIAWRTIIRAPLVQRIGDMTGCKIK